MTMKTFGDKFLARSARWSASFDCEVSCLICCMKQLQIILIFFYLRVNINSTCILDPNTLKNFEMPQFNSEASVTHQFGKNLPSSDYQTELKTMHVTQEGALSGWKICPGKFSSLVNALGGSIEIRLIQTTQINTKLFGCYCDKRKPLVLSLIVFVQLIKHYVYNFFSFQVPLLRKSCFDNESLSESCVTTRK